MLRSLFRAAVSGKFVAIYSTFMVSTSSMCTSTAQARRIWVSAAGASNDCILVVTVAPCAFSHLVITFRGRRKGNLVFWCSKVDFS